MFWYWYPTNIGNGLGRTVVKTDEKCLYVAILYPKDLLKVVFFDTLGEVYAW
jgi:hypothetical protein